ncbi:MULTISPECIES: hypothetical protein [unclassified Shewanella]|uniref:hypothetical protein n=1 Tax=unclassified Shewanella TaxID=196818 RepID=UPI001C7CAEEF|nr:MULTISPECIES: hypothetical protein [unclassified Shewanella]
MDNVNNDDLEGFAEEFWSRADKLNSESVTKTLNSCSIAERLRVLNYQGAAKDRNIHKVDTLFQRYAEREHARDTGSEHELGRPWTLHNVDGKLLSKRYSHDIEEMRNERKLLEASFNKELSNLKTKLHVTQEDLRNARSVHLDITNELSVLLSSNESLKKINNQLNDENTELKQKQLQGKIAIEVPAFVDNAKKELATNEKHFRELAIKWNLRGNRAIGAAAILSVIFVIYTGILTFSSKTDLNWAIYGTMLFKEMLVVSILAATAKYCYGVASAYTHESLKRTDRMHAIGFGKMYLEIYGSQVDQQDVKSIFENWNLDSDSSFTKIKEADFENKTYNKLADAIISLTKQESKKLPEPQSPPL